MCCAHDGVVAQFDVEATEFIPILSGRHHLVKQDQGCPNWVQLSYWVGLRPLLSIMILALRNPGSDKCRLLSKLTSGPGLDAVPKRGAHSAAEWRCHLAHGEPAMGTQVGQENVLSPIGAASGLPFFPMKPLRGSRIIFGGTFTYGWLAMG